MTQTESGLNVTHAVAALFIIYAFTLISKYGFKNSMQLLLILILKKVPGGKQFISAEQEKAKRNLIKTLSASFHKSPNPYYTLPQQGVPRESIRKELLHQLSLEKAVRNGRGHGGIYTSVKQKYDKYLNNENDIISMIDKHMSMKEEAYLYFSHTNKLYPFLFPGLRKFEVEVVSMISNMVHSKNAAGVLTSGGTESIFLAIYAWKNYGQKKACYYLNIEAKTIELTSSYTVNLNKVEVAVDSNTICIVGSAPCFGYCVVDDIQGLCQIARKNGDIPVHVDNCLGGFLISFLDVKPFDFRVEGVCSMSVDVHKQAGADKGSSAVIYSEYKYREHQYFAYTDWIGGLYANTVFTGSFNGGLIAVAWSMILFKGEAKFKQNAIKAHAAITHLKERLSEIEDCDVLGDPIGCGIAFKLKNELFESDYAIIDQMKRIGGWQLHGLQFPMAIHLQNGHNCNWIDDADELISDLKKAI
eukprot:356501_1